MVILRQRMFYSQAGIGRFIGMHAMFCDVVSLYRVLLTDFASFKPILLPAVSPPLCMHLHNTMHLFCLHYRTILLITLFSLTLRAGVPATLLQRDLWMILQTVAVLVSLSPWISSH